MTNVMEWVNKASSVTCRVSADRAMACAVAAITIYGIWGSGPPLRQMAMVVERVATATPEAIIAGGGIALASIGAYTVVCRQFGPQEAEDPPAPWWRVPTPTMFKGGATTRFPRLTMGMLACAVAAVALEGIYGRGTCARGLELLLRKGRKRAKAPLQWCAIGGSSLSLGIAGFMEFSNVAAVACASFAIAYCKHLYDMPGPSEGR